jgi:hypothetical protein
MTGGSEGQSDKLKADRSRNEIPFEKNFRGEQIHFSFNFLHSYCHINAHTHNSLLYVHSMRTKTNSLHSQHRETLGGYLNHCEHTYKIVILSYKCRLSRSIGIPTQVSGTPHSRYGLYDMQVDMQ